MRGKNDYRASAVILNWHLSGWRLQSQLLQGNVSPSPVHLSLLISFLHSPSFSAAVSARTHPAAHQMFQSGLQKQHNFKAKQCRASGGNSVTTTLFAVIRIPLGGHSSTEHPKCWSCRPYNFQKIWDHPLKWHLDNNKLPLDKYESSRKPCIWQGLTGLEVSIITQCTHIQRCNIDL